MILRLFLTGLLAASQCRLANNPTKFMPDKDRTTENYYATVGSIPLPEGYTRVKDTLLSFTCWLRNVKLKPDRTVYLYNGAKKRNQSAQYAVLDIPLGKKDLQQCADAVMRLRAQYLYDNKRYAEINFFDNAGTSYPYKGKRDSLQFERYLERVFARCGTASLERQLHKVDQLKHLLPGNVLIKGGSPGHAVLVMDVATNASGKKICLLAQSYMPAQDMHILINPIQTALGAWYEVNDYHSIVTPEWTFEPASLKRW
ncbi:MAG: DUF4846 domain-containing protein [Agriterribacter sp.]|jgi:hypothetical protein